MPHCSLQTDDMLWYVQISSFYSSTLLSAQMKVLEVYRRQSKSQPSPGSRAINWEETLYLNVLLHNIVYTLTCAVCTKTSPQNLQILRKNSRNVFASPSRRRMDVKGDAEEISYPNIYFIIDNFEDLFNDIIVRDGECVCVELLAKDVSERLCSTVFLGSVRYEVLKQIYDAKVCSTWRWAQSLVSPKSHKRLEFVIMRGPHGKGFAEMAVSKVPGIGYDSPTCNQAPYEDYDVVEAVEQFHRRRSDNNLVAKGMGVSFCNGVTLFGHSVHKSFSETDTCDRRPEIKANSIDDEIEESTFNYMWSMQGFSQAWHRLREKRRECSVPLNAFLTYVTLPWHSIIEDLLDHPHQPILSFDEESTLITPD
ncbi:unnamed protein product [Soboliphyme baturini]|uniref:CACTA en-spm transposon protein n=1 Tax=Soboliphyme baturini TaxID=241478 RepID=A0A183J364_9BILA|nr:unnamed protein product [Soboliphyme baturini]